jgi:hypothetical protein
MGIAAGAAAAAGTAAAGISAGTVAAGVAAAGAAAQIGSSLLSSSAAKSAAGQSAAASGQASALQQAQQAQTRADLFPYNAGGQDALAALRHGLGIGGWAGQTGTKGTPGYAAGTLPPGYSIQDIAGTNPGSNSQDAADFLNSHYLRDATRLANGNYSLDGREFDQNWQEVGGGAQGGGFKVLDANGNVVGTYGAGTDKASIRAQFPGAAATQDTPGTAPPDGYGAYLKPFDVKTFDMSPEALANTPGYRFNLLQGQQAVTNSNAAKGLGISGAALRGAADYATGLANSTWQDQANNFYRGQDAQSSNYYTAQNNAYNRLMGTAQLGENAAAQTGAQGTIAAGNAGNNIVGAGAAQAAGTVGQANAFGNIGTSIGNAYNSYQQNQLYNSLTAKLTQNGVYGANAGVGG